MMIRESALSCLLEQLLVCINDKFEVFRIYSLISYAQLSFWLNFIPWLSTKNEQIFNDTDNSWLKSVHVAIFFLMNIVI